MAARYAMPLAILGLTGAGIASRSSSHLCPLHPRPVALTTVVGVGLNILLGLTGQVSLGHIGFYAIGAYATSILTLKGMSFWLAFPLSGALAGAIGAVLAVPALRVTGPYLAMITIAFAFIVQHGTIEWRELTGGQNGLMGITMPSLGPLAFAEGEIAMFATLLAGLALYLFHRLAGSAWGKAMVAVRDSETAARSIGLNPVAIKTVAFALSALFTGLAGAIFAPLMMFVAPDSFPFSQSILFLLAVIVGGAAGDRPGRRGNRHRGPARTARVAGRVSVAVLWRAAARGAVARPGRRDRHARAPHAACQSGAAAAGRN